MPTTTRQPGPKTLIKQTKAAFPEVKRREHYYADLERGAWYWAGSAVGDLCDRHKKDIFMIEVERACPFKEVREALDGRKHRFPRGHRFLLQADFDRRPGQGKGKIMTWLHQSGQIISFGVPAVEFEHGDFESFKKAFQEAMDQDMSETIRQLYKSGYDSYGR